MTLRRRAEPVPEIIYWRLTTGVELVTLPGRNDLDYGRHDRVPVAATHFRTRPDLPWRALDELPASWGLVLPRTHEGPPCRE